MSRKVGDHRARRVEVADPRLLGGDRETRKRVYPNRTIYGTLPISRKPAKSSSLLIGGVPVVGQKSRPQFVSTDIRVGNMLYPYATPGEL